MNEDDLNANDLDALDAINSWDGDISKALEEEDDADSLLAYYQLGRAISKLP